MAERFAGRRGGREISRWEREGEGPAALQCGSVSGPATESGL